MRVAILGNYPAESFRSQADGERLPPNTSHWNANLAKGLVRQGLEVHVLALAPGLRQTLVAKDDGVTVHWLALPHQARVASCFQWPRLIVQNTLRRIQPDLVHGVGTEHEYPYLAQVSGYPYLIGVHVLVRDVMARIRQSRKRRLRLHLFKHLESRVLEQAPFVTVTTPFLAEAIGTGGRRRVFVIPNAVHPRFEQMAVQQKPDTPCRFLFAGRISPEKNIETLLTAFIRLHASRPDIRLDLVGGIEDRGYYDMLMKFINTSHAASAVVFHGQQSSGRLVQFMRQAHVLVLPSRYEAFGLVLAEAMSMGLPVIASRIGGIPYLVRDRLNGLLFTPDDDDALFRHMALLARDARTRHNMGQQGRTIAAGQFSADRVAEQMSAVYNKVLESNHVSNELRLTIYALA